MIAAVRDSWTAFSNWRLIIWVALYQLLSKQARGSKIMFMVSVLEPLIVISAIAFVVSCFMPITAKMMEKVRAELDARHASLKATAAGEELESIS